MNKRVALLLTLSLGGCLRTKAEPAAQLTLGPTAIDFGPAFVGATPQRPLTVHNAGNASGHVTLSATGPFRLDATAFDVGPGADVVVAVTYAPAQVGHDTGTVSLGAQQVALSGDGQAPLDCAKVACREVHFDPNAGACVEAQSADGVSCASDGCYSQSTHVCQSGTCIEQPRTGERCVNDWVAVTMPGRATQAMAYDSDRQRVVVFGGIQSEALNDTWEWDGARWIEVRPSASPPPHAWASMVYDSTRKRMVLFAGELGTSETWEFDGTTWLQRSPVHSPPARIGQAMAFDPDRGVAVLFGGVISFSQTTAADLNDTWEWNGDEWTQVSPTTSPSGRLSAGLVYDPVAKTMVLYGGVAVWPDGLTDVWHYDGSTWSQVSTTNAPPADPTALLVYDTARRMPIELSATDDRVWALDGMAWAQLAADNQPSFSSVYGPSTVYDSARQRLITYEAVDFPIVSNKTWSWDGTHWERIDPLTPAARADPGMVYDSIRQVVVLFGGGGGESSARSSAPETWEWNGDGWTQRQPQHSPPARRAPAMTFDSSRGVVVMFGGQLAENGALLADTWEYDGVDWRQSFPAHVPPARLSASAAYDADLQQSVIFGGTAAASAPAPLGDTWGWNGLDWTQLPAATSPPGLFMAAMTYDAARHQLVLYGGETADQHLQDSTWVYDGQTWSQKAQGPAQTVRGSLVYDPVHQRSLLFGGATTGDPPATFQRGLFAWDGNAWTPISTLRPGPAVAGAGVAFDAARGELMVFGGQIDGTPTSSDTWLFVPSP